MRTLTVLERTTLAPRRAGSEWDSVDSRVEGDSFQACTVKSLRELLREPEAPMDGSLLLAEWLGEERSDPNVFAGFRRSVLERMALRDQPLLDECQDEVFRLPLNSRLVILGPPGTGKTTTLIRRLGQKLVDEFLTDQERSQVERTAAGRAKHDRSWLLFTPSDLLKQYVKEAFARENIAAADTQIKTWDDYRHELARDSFRFLRRDGGSGFVLKKNLPSMLADTPLRQAQWFDDFDKQQKSAFGDDLREYARSLSAFHDPAIAPVGRQALKELSDGDFRLVSTLRSLTDVGALLTPELARLRREVDQTIRRMIGKELERDKHILTNLLEAMSKSTPEPDADPDADDEEYTPPTGSAREDAFAALTKAIGDQARRAVSGRKLSPQSRSARLLEVLGRSLREDELKPVGTILQVLSSARRFADPVRWYFAEMPSRYRKFRRACAAQGAWYAMDGYGTSEIGALEADVLLLAYLKGMRELLGDRSVARDFAAGGFQALRPAYDILRNQIAVDEATDFSPVQLACMASLCDPATRSFVACGDFRQRITRWGARSIEDLNWAVKDIEVRRFDVSYRHSRQLLEFAAGLARLSESDADAAELPPHVDSEGVKPLLLTGLKDVQAVGESLAKAIGKVERLTGKLPTIAVFVDDESEVEPMANALDAALADQNIHAVACRDGRVMGQDGDVRVFDVRHIKGLEFEAVFFVGIDSLARRSADVFDNYLYVGATRAAMYLGMTTAESSLPTRISALAHHFTDAWPSAR